jgi:hypothetical protein
MFFYRRKDMKKFRTNLFVFCGVILTLSAVCAETSELYENPDYRIDNSSYYSGTTNYRLFGGFGFRTYIPSKLSLETVSENEVTKTKEKDAAEGISTPYAVVGYSQGGPRSLAYATILKNYADTGSCGITSNDYNRLKAVITVSGIDKGIKALDGGFGTFKAKYNEDTNILYHGGIGLSHCGGIVWYVVSGICVDLVKKYGTDFIKDHILPGSMATYVSCAFEGGSYDQLSELYDMMPRSSYLQQYVCKTKAEQYKAQSGTRTVVSVAWRRVGFFSLPYFVISRIPVYSYYTKYTDIAKFANDMPVGYIVGTNSDTLSMFDYSSGDTPTTDFTSYGPKEKKTREYIDAAQKGLGVGYGCNMAKYYTLSAAETLVHILSCGFASPDYGSSTYHTYADYCADAGNWLGDVDGQLNDLKGSSENDGLVAKESQFYPKSVHSNILTTSQNEIYCRLNENHATIDPVANKYTKTEIKLLLGKVRELK